MIQGTVNDDTSRHETDNPIELEARIASLEKEIQELSDLLRNKNYL